MNNLAPAEYQNVRYLLSLLYPIEMAIAGMFSTINVQVAAVFTRNPKELRDRKEQFNYQRFELCSVMGTPPGPQLNAQDGVRFVV